MPVLLSRPFATRRQDFHEYDRCPKCREFFYNDKNAFFGEWISTLGGQFKLCFKCSCKSLGKNLKFVDDDDVDYKCPSCLNPVFLKNWQQPEFEGFMLKCRHITCKYLSKLVFLRQGLIFHNINFMFAHQLIIKTCLDYYVFFLNYVTLTH